MSFYEWVDINFFVFIKCLEAVEDSVFLDLAFNASYVPVDKSNLFILNYLLLQLID
jgi:hypothetical protein